MTWLDPWAAFTLGTDGLSAKYCEANRIGAWLRQPMDSVSNVAYLVACVSSLRSTGAVPRALRLSFAALLLLLALGSGLFHASIALFAQKLDMAGTYGVVLALIALPLATRVRHERLAAVTLGLFACLALFYLLDFYLYGPWLLPLLLAAAAVPAVITVRQSRSVSTRRQLQLAFLGMIVGGAAWVLDDHKVACAPRSPLQWHALWHCSTAYGAYRLFRMYDLHLDETP